MGGLNKAMLIGRLGGDPEIKTIGTGDTVCNFSMATSENWMKDGEKQERTEWHRVVAWGRLAEVCVNYLAKGKQVYVEGKLQTRSYEDNEGIKRWSTEIRAFTVQFLDSAPKEEQQEEDQGDIPF